MHMFSMSTVYRGKYQIAPLKVVVGGDRPKKALLMHIEKQYKFSFCQKKINQTSSCICSMCLYCIGKYQIVPLNTVVEADWPMKAPSMHIQKPLYKREM